MKQEKQEMLYYSSGHVVCVRLYCKCMSDPNSCGFRDEQDTSTVEWHRLWFKDEYDIMTPQQVKQRKRLCRDKHRHKIVRQTK